MLVSIDTLLQAPVMSLQTGTELAVTTGAILDPRQMVVVAFYAEGTGLEQNPSTLHVNDIREISDIGLIVDDATKLMSQDGLVRLNEIIAFEFELMGLKVVDEHKRKLGKISGYTIETSNYNVMQVYTEQSLLRSISTMSNTIHRSQIVSVNNTLMVVRSPTVREGVTQAAKDAGQVLSNPFRQGTLPPD